MVPVAADHAADVIDGGLLPWFRDGVLPAGNLFEDEKADLVAAIEEVTRLRVMRAADDIAMQIRAQDAGVFPLHARLHRLPYEGEGLMAIEAVKFDDLSVE